LPAAEQLLPTKPLPLARNFDGQTADRARTPEVKKWTAERFAQLRSEGQFVPLSIGKDTVRVSRYDGGAEWGGPADRSADGHHLHQLE